MTSLRNTSSSQDDPALQNSSGTHASSSLRNTLKQALPEAALNAYRHARLRARYFHWSSLKPSQYPEAIKQWYFRATGKQLNLDNPSTYDEKLQWIKLYGTTPEMGRLSDKYLVREWVAKRVGREYLVPLLGVWEDPADINFDALPEQFVLKATHGCGWNIIVRQKAELDYAHVRKQLQSWLNTNYAFAAGLELQYQYCQPRIIAEQYLENAPGDLYDYKFFCFKGRAYCVGLIRGRGGNSEEACFDRNWQLLPCTYCSHPRIEESVPQPAGFQQALRIAEMLAADFEHVRVDMYILNDGTVKFGEMTFTTLSGISNWDPPEYNYVFGELIDLPTPSSAL